MPFAIGELDGNNNIGTEYKRQEQKILDFQQNMSGNMGPNMTPPNVMNNMSSGSAGNAACGCVNKDLSNVIIYLPTSFSSNLYANNTIFFSPNAN